ncbi:lipid droplet surface protein [Nannochloropsis oceanica]
MGQSWRRPESEPRIGKLECFVERARNLNPQSIEVVKDWPNCNAFLVFSLRLSRFHRAESSRKIAMQNELPQTAPIWREKVAEWNDVPYPPKNKVSITLAYEKDKNTDAVAGGYYGMHSKEWTVQQGVSPVVSPAYAWRGLRSKPSASSTSAPSSPSSTASPSPTRIGHREYRGEVKVAIRWSQTEPEFRPYVHLLSHCVARTQAICRPLYRLADPLVASLLDVFVLSMCVDVWYKGMLLPAYAFLTQNRSILLAAFLACFLPLALLWVPALVFFPITLLMFWGSFLLFLCLTPVGCALVWFLLASEPAQSKLLRPFLQICLKTKGVRGWFTLPCSPYSP